MAKPIMLQGTMSGAGKSLIGTALCRIFKQDGYRTAPFKSQNMSLNSFITAEGLEMGRAQVVQAEAAGCEPDVRMNPVLLKPTDDTGSQVIVNGKVRGSMSARDYFGYKKSLLPEILQNYESLASENDIVVIEGAGSPAEINLKEDDIVNMGIAKETGAPVLLVGDIDRGGVFAQLLGTILLLEEEEKRLVKGLIVNKFRGDRSILDPGITLLEERGHIPVVGVTPFVDVDLEDEDSLSERLHHRTAAGGIDIAVIRLPRIANFTDFNRLESLPGVSVRYVRRTSDLKTPDLIVLPGTKNTMGDLVWLRESGLEAALLAANRSGIPLFGICGGYQMLGEMLSDPEGVEGGGSLPGLGLLPMDTVFTAEKTRTRVTGQTQALEGPLAALSHLPVEGYEIHMGRSVRRDSGRSLCSLTDRVTGHSGADGSFSGSVYGTYVHGFFDTPEIASALVRALAGAKGTAADVPEMTDYALYRQQQYDRLADVMRAHLDMDAVYAILNAGP